MQETFVELSCPNCGKHWESNPNRLPTPDETFRCPDCDASRPLSVFAHTQRDLEVIREL